MAGKGGELSSAVSRVQKKFNDELKKLVARVKAAEKKAARAVSKARGRGR